MNSIKAQYSKKNVNRPALFDNDVYSTAGKEILKAGESGQWLYNLQMMVNAFEIENKVEQFLANPENIKIINDAIIYNFITNKSAMLKRSDTLQRKKAEKDNKTYTSNLEQELKDLENTAVIKLLSGSYGLAGNDDSSDQH